MRHRGIEFELKMIEPGIWKYRFQIGRAVKTGKTKAKVDLMAKRQVGKRIDRELRNANFDVLLEKNERQV